jgi:hypothetical protein
MESRLQHPVIKWFLIIIAFIASFHAGWKALEYIHRAPKTTPKLEYQMREPKIPSQESPAFLIEDLPNPIELRRPTEPSAVSRGDLLRQIGRVFRGPAKR